MPNLPAIELLFLGMVVGHDSPRRVFVGDEFLEFIQVLIDADRNDLEPGAVVFLPVREDVGNLCAAGTAPGRPEVISTTLPSNCDMSSGFPSMV